MTYEVRFLVDNFSVDNSEQVTALLDEFDASASRICETSVLTLGVEVPDGVEPLDAIRSEIVKVQSAVGLKVVDVDLDLVDEGEIAERFGQSRQLVNLYVRGVRGGDFPEPYGLPGGRRVWTWAAVARWARSHKQDWDDAAEPDHLSRERQRELAAWLTRRASRLQSAEFGLVFNNLSLACTVPTLLAPIHLSSTGWSERVHSHEALATR